MIPPKSRTNRFNVRLSNWTCEGRRRRSVFEAGTRRAASSGLISLWRWVKRVVSYLTLRATSCRIQTETSRTQSTSAAACGRASERGAAVRVDGAALMLPRWTGSRLFKGQDASRSQTAARLQPKDNKPARPERCGCQSTSPDWSGGCRRQTGQITSKYQPGRFYEGGTPLAVSDPDQKSSSLLSQSTHTQTHTLSSCSHSDTRTRTREVQHWWWSGLAQGSSWSQSCWTGLCSRNFLKSKLTFILKRHFLHQFLTVQHKRTTSCSS